MTLLLSAVLLIVVAILGFALLPIISMVVTMPILFLARFIGPWLAYMVSRYVGFIFDISVLVVLITWAGSRFDLVTWPAWLVAAWCVFTLGNTLILFDVQCYLGDTGAWSKDPIAGEMAAEPSSRS